MFVCMFVCMSCCLVGGRVNKGYLHFDVVWMSAVSFEDMYCILAHTWDTWDK